MTFLRVVLFTVSIGLMVASSGLDGSYLARAMGPIFGYTLNTVSDIVSEVLMYAFARIRQTAAKGSKRHRLSSLLLVANVFIVAYAWFFGWRELLLVLPGTEGAAAAWVAPIMAGFVPIALLGAGVAQALVDGRIDDTDKTQDDTTVTSLRAKLRQSNAELAQVRATLARDRELVAPEYTDFARIHADSNGDLHHMAPSDGNMALVRAGFAPIAESTWRNWRNKFEEMSE